MAARAMIVKSRYVIGFLKGLPDLLDDLRCSKARSIDIALEFLSQTQVAERRTSASIADSARL